MFVSFFVSESLTDAWIIAGDIINEENPSVSKSHRDPSVRYSFASLLEMEMLKKVAMKKKNT